MPNLTQPHARANTYAGSLVLVLALLLGGYASGTHAAQPESRLVTVGGKGSVSVAPNEAYISVGIQQRGKEMDALRQSLNSVASAVLAHLTALGIEERHINGSAITIRPEYRWNKNTETQELQGYFVQRSFDVKLTDLDLLAALLEGAADAGANEISSPRLGHSEAADLQRQALAAAAADARANAETIADSVGLAVGSAREISTLQAGRPTPMAMASDMLRMAPESAAPAGEYVTGEIVFESHVSASFDLLQR